MTVILSNIAIASLIAVFAFLVGLRGKRHRLAHWLWLAVLIKLVTPPIVTVPVPVSHHFYDFFSKPPASESTLSAGPQDLGVQNLVGKPADVASPFADLESQSLVLPETPSRGAHAAVDNSQSLASRSRLVKDTAGKTTPVSKRWFDSVTLKQIGFFLLLAIWIGVAAALLLRDAWRFFALGKLLKDEAEPNSEATRFVEALISKQRNRADGASLTGTSLTGAIPELTQARREATRRNDCRVTKKRGPVVLLMPARIAPMLFGLFSWTFIVCPKELWRKLTPAQREVFLAHEATHFARRDHWKRWLEWFVGCVYWWCPLVRIAKSQLVRFEEIACDRAAIRLMHSGKKCYAETLLCVADYLDYTSGPVPQFASQFNSSSMLEERLRLIAQLPKQTGNTSPETSIGLAACLAFLAVHPIPFRMISSFEQVAIGRPDRSAYAFVRKSSDTQRNVQSADIDFEADLLPAPPSGWWNKSPAKKWASIPIANGFELFAEAGERLELRKGGQVLSKFQHNEVQAFALLGDPQTQAQQRLLVGGSDGGLRIWDLENARNISLIGRHAASISSIAYHPQSGLVASDTQGSVIHWDLQSGSVISTWTSQGSPVQSVRFSSDGNSLAVLLGKWDTAELSSSVYMLDIDGLRQIQHGEVPTDTAVVLDSQQGWLAVSWCGSVGRPGMEELGSGSPLRFSKERVSELVFCQDARSAISLHEEGMLSRP